MQKMLETKLYQIYRCEPADWEKIKKDVMGVKNSAFEAAVRENEKEIANYFLNEKGVCLVAYRKKGGIVAYIAGGHIEDDEYCQFDGGFGLGNTFYIESIGVLPKFQNKGIGSLLTELQFSEVRKMGYQRITAHATDDRFVTVLEKLGTTKAEFFPEWVGSRDVWYMERSLS
jgi:ribosomal protein S18 acetylase RimI-like enzyme